MLGKIFYSLALVSVFNCFVACDDDDDKDVSSIIGTWQGTKVDIEFLITGVPAPITETDEDFEGEAEFKQDGTVIFTEDGEQTNGTWAQNGDKLILSVPSDDYAEISGTYTIKQLTSSNLSLYIEKEGAFEDPDSGLELEGTVKATLFFDKE